MNAKQIINHQLYCPERHHQYYAEEESKIAIQPDKPNGRYRQHQSNTVRTKYTANLRKKNLPGEFSDGMCNEKVMLSAELSA